MNVIAPGTQGKLQPVEITGTPEVAINIKSQAQLTGSNDSAWTIGDTFYCPIVFTIGSKTVDGKTATSISDLQNKINDALQQYNKNYEPGKNLKTDATDAVPSISWSWPFDDEANSGTNDQLDTALTSQPGLPKFGINVTTTVTQID